MSRAELIRSRNFIHLWIAQVLSGIGSQSTAVAMPLLTLALTGSPGEAGLVGVMSVLAFPLVALPAGVLVDRFDRRRLLLGCAFAQALTMTSIVVMLLIARPPISQLLAAAFVNSAFDVIAVVAERGLLAAVVPASSLPDAVALNEARASVATLSGAPLGGVLFGIARSLPFVVDAASFLAASLNTAFVHPVSHRDTTAASTQRPVAAIREGIAWLWSRPFMRASSMLFAASNVTLPAVYLLAILIPRQHDASPGAIGLGFAVIELGGIAGALVSSWALARLNTRWAVLAEPWAAAAMMPILLVVHEPVLIGLVGAGMLLPMATASAVVIGQRIVLAPDELRGRVQASASFLAGTLAWLGPLSVGLLFEHFGESVTVLTACGWTLAVAISATVSRGLRREPSDVS